MRLSAVWFDLSSNRAMVLTTAGLTLATVAFANIVYAIALRLLFVETVRLSDPMVLLLITVITAVIALPIFAGFLILFRRNLALQAHLTEAIRRDHLTRVMSREAFVGDFDALARKDPRAYPGSLLVVDVDHFKKINDTLGHETGDRALVAVAEALKSGVRPGDFVGRIGGEEFAVFLAGVDAETAQGVAERLRRGVAGLELKAAHLSVSIGAVHLAVPQSFKASFEVADRLLYAAKGAGRNCVRFEALGVAA